MFEEPCEGADAGGGRCRQVHRHETDENTPCSGEKHNKLGLFILNQSTQFTGSLKG